MRKPLPLWRKIFLKYSMNSISWLLWKLIFFWELLSKVLGILFRVPNGCSGVLPKIKIMLWKSSQHNVPFLYVRIKRYKMATPKKYLFRNYLQHQVKGQFCSWRYVEWQTVLIIWKFCKQFDSKADGLFGKQSFNFFHKQY